MTAPSRTHGGATISVRCRLFGRYGELVGQDEIQVELSERALVSDAIAALRARASGAVLPPTPLVAVNRRHVPHSTPLADGDEVAVLPPLAGG